MNGMMNARMSGASGRGGKTEPKVDDSHSHCVEQEAYPSLPAGRGADRSTLILVGVCPYGGLRRFAAPSCGPGSRLTSLACKADFLGNHSTPTLRQPLSYMGSTARKSTPSIPSNGYACHSLHGETNRHSVARNSHIQNMRYC